MAQGGTEEALEAVQELDGVKEWAGSKGWLPVVQTWGHVAVSKSKDLSGVRSECPW